MFLRCMANSFTQLYVHAVFSVKHRDKLLEREWREEVFKYSSTTISMLKCKPIAVNGVADHMHILAGVHPSISISELVSKVKSNSSRFINENFVQKGRFEWQVGYSAFSNSQSQVPRIARYIADQERHHKKITFRSEYLDFLKKYEVIYEPKYLFEFFD
jgi:putative transposase